MKRIVIVGAGLTGLSAAYHLQRRGVEATILEKEAAVGGVCRTLERDGFHFDLTGHLLHLQRPESAALLAELGLERALRRHRRRAAVALAGVITPYPLQIHTHRLPPAIKRDCLLGFVQARQARAEQEDGESSFAAWVQRRFGDGFARHFFLPYNGKLFCCDPAELSTDWVGRYVPQPRLEDVINGAFGLFRGEVGYNATFLYPRRGGISLLAEALAARVGNLRLATEVVAVHLAERFLELGTGERVGWDVLVSTVPLTHLAARTHGLPMEGRQAAARLRSVAVENINLGVRGRAPRREHWLYVPEPRFPFYRVGVPSNHGTTAPAGHHTLSVEVSLPSGEVADRDLETRCYQGLRELGLMKPEATVVTSVRARIDPAYVVHDAARPAAVAALRALYRAAGVVLAGRWAEWKYSTMEDALLDGVTVARRVAP